MSVLDDFYPGSKVRRESFKPPGLESVFVLEEVTGPPASRAKEPGGMVDLYSSGQLAKVLNRAAGTIRLWENNETIPEPLWSNGSQDPRGFRRYYSLKQCLRMREIADECGILEHKYRPVGTTSFAQLVHDLWEEDDG